MNFQSSILKFSLMLFVGLITACASSEEQKKAEEAQRMQNQRAKYQWQVDFCRKKGFTTQHPSFNACINWAKAEQDIQAAQAARCAPNWAAISAALGKPQLGGFTASLGDASKEFARQQDSNGCR